METQNAQQETTVELSTADLAMQAKSEHDAKRTKLEAFNITMSLAEYLTSYTKHGRDFITIDKVRRDEICKQDGWQQVVYIEEIVDSECYRLYDIETWKFRETNVPELKNEKRSEEFAKAKEEHNQLLAWKLEARNKLVTKAGLDSERADRYIAGCIAPETAVSKNKYTNAEGYLDEAGYNKALKFYYDLRLKLKYPFSN